MVSGKQQALKWIVASVTVACVLGSLVPPSGAKERRADSQFLIQGQAGVGVPSPRYDAEPPANVHTLSYKIVRQLPHDADAFTQGLFVDSGAMFESTGLYGQSSVRKVDIASGKVLQMSRYSESIFGEGITKHADGSIYGLSWLEGLAFKINPDTLVVEKQMSLPFREGWGVTSDGTHLIVSDGSHQLHYVDTDFKLVKSVTVRDELQGMDVYYLNELEFIDGKVYANIYGLDHIAIIDPASGKVEKYVDCRGLWTGGFRGSNSVFNGIAYDKEHGKLYVTGKKWPVMYEIQLVDNAKKL